MPFDKNEINLLQKVYDKQETADGNIVRLTEKVGQQNHRIDNLEGRAQKEEGIKEEREKWEQRERENQRRREDKQGRNSALQIAATGILVTVILVVVEYIIPLL